MSNIYTHQDSNVRKTWALMTIFFVLIILLGWVFGQIYQNTSILYFAIILSLAMNVGSFWYSDKIVLKMTGAKRVARDSYRDLWNIVENLSITAGLPMPALYIVDDPAPNAFATGRNKENAAVAVTSGLLNMLERDELEGVIAHELAHIGNRDILISTVVVVLVGSITLLSDFLLRSMLWGGGRRGDGKVHMVLLLIGVVLAILSPIVALIIKLAVSRKREFLADASGALLTRYPEGLAKALEKITSYKGDMTKGNHAMAHLFISSPFNSKKSASGFMTKLFMTHPPTEERVRALRG